MLADDEAVLDLPDALRAEAAAQELQTLLDDAGEGRGAGALLTRHLQFLGWVVLPGLRDAVRRCGKLRFFSTSDR